MANSNKMWLKRVLIPLWVLEIIVMGIFFILACILLGVADSISDNDSSYYYTDSDVVENAYKVSGGVVLAITALCIILTAVEIGFFARHKLSPVFHLVSACVKALIWLIWFFLTIASAAAVGGSSALDIVLSLIVALCALGQVIYGSIIMHRERKGFYRGPSGSIANELPYYAPKLEPSEIGVQEQRAN